MEQRRGHFLVLGVSAVGKLGQIGLVKVFSSFVDELTSLAVLPAHCLGILINLTRKMAWLVA